MPNFLTIIYIIACLFLFPKFRKQNIQSFLGTAGIISASIFFIPPNNVIYGFIQITVIFFMMDIFLLLIGVSSILMQMPHQKVFKTLTYLSKCPYLSCLPEILIENEEIFKQNQLIKREVNRGSFRDIKTLIKNEENDTQQDE